MLFLSPPKNQQNVYLIVVYQHLFSLHHPVTQPHFTQTPVTQPVFSTPVSHPPCHTPNPFHHLPLLLPLPFTIIHARTNLVPWKIAINRSARAVFAEWDRDQFGFLFGVCDDTVWAVLNTPPGGPLRARPDFPAPADLAAGDGHAVRDAFKRATDAKSSWLACSAAFCAAIIDSIGKRLPVTFVPPQTHRSNPAERAVRTGKNHLISVFYSTHPDFPDDLWDRLLPYAEITLNVLRPWRPDPTLSAWSGLHRLPYDFSAHPLHPSGLFMQK